MCKQICVPRLNCREFGSHGGEPFARDPNFDGQRVGQFLSNCGQFNPIGGNAERVGERASRSSALGARGTECDRVRVLLSSDRGRGRQVASAQGQVQFARVCVRVAEQLFLSE